MQHIDRDPKKQGVGKTVLIVDDNAPIRTMVAAAFLSDGFKRCTETEKGKQIAPWTSDHCQSRPAPTVEPWATT